MTEILTADYMSESTEDLIKRAEQMMLAYPRIYPKADDIIPYSRSGFGFMNQTYTPAIRSLAPACYSITVKNVITVDDSSIIVCSGPATGTCGSIPVTCPVGPLTPSDYVNMVATVTAQVAQTGVDITFKYVLDDVPTTTVRTVNLIAGPNTIYAFPGGNVQYLPDTTLILYGAEVTRY